MLYSILRTLKCRQIGQVQVNISVSGAAATPVASGPDASFISSITDNGVGSWTINLKEAGKIVPHVSAIVGLTADTTFIVSAVTTSSITITAKSVAAAPAAKDANFNLQFQVSDQLSYYL